MATTRETVAARLRASWRHLAAAVRRLAARVRNRLDPRAGR